MARPPIIDLSDDTFTEPEIIEILTSENNNGEPTHQHMGPELPHTGPKESFLDLNGQVHQSTPSSPIVTYERPVPEQSSQVRKPKAILISSSQPETQESANQTQNIQIQQKQFDITPSHNLPFHSQFDSPSPEIPDSLKRNFSKKSIQFDLSPVKRLSPRISSKFDPIEDSSFTFLQLQPTNKTPLMDLVRWLSDSEDDLFSKETQIEPSHKDQKLKLSVIKEDVEKLPLPKVEQSSPIRNTQEMESVDKFNYSNDKKPKKYKLNKSAANRPETKLNPFLNYQYTAKELKDANKITRKKEELFQEMIINIPNSLELDHELVNHIFEHSIPEFYNCDIPLIYWKRKVKAIYDQSRDIFIPCAPKEVQEKTLVLYYKADELISRVQDKSIKLQVDKALALARLRNSSLKYAIIIIIEGYDQYVLKLKNVENKRYKDKVLERLNENSQTKKRKLEESDITAKEVHYMLCKTQLDLGVNIFPTRSNKESLEWLYSFTYTISYSLYDKYERNSGLANLGTVKSGSDPKSTFLQTVRQFKMMTEPKADKLYGLFQNIYSIYLEFEKNGTLGKDAFGKNVVPPTTDTAMRNAFLADDPNEVINE